ncbi:N-formylglutamate amidohydrolase [Gramella sp. BOM4]|nr:N-formylglutamate amidohydrolase [Christiangramia bathymodioli]
MKLVLTCEHTFPDIPQTYRILFRDNKKVLKTHEAYDPGAFDLFTQLKPLADFSEYQIIGRLLVEVNRSVSHPALFSRFSNVLEKQQKKDLLEAYYYPYRFKVEKEIGQFLTKEDPVLHLSVHTFTPILRGEVRNCDIGILYDPSRKLEKAYAQSIKNGILKENPNLKVRFNYPYLGKADGFTTYLRKKFPANYSGIELELNQKWVKKNKLDEPIKDLIFNVVKELK